MAPAAISLRQRRRTSMPPSLNVVYEASSSSSPRNLFQRDDSSLSLNFGVSVDNAPAVDTWVTPRTPALGTLALQPQSRRRPTTLRLDLDDLIYPCKPPKGSGISNDEDVDDDGVYCESPTNLEDASDSHSINKDNASLHSTPSLRVPSPTPTTLSTLSTRSTPATSPPARSRTGQQRSASWTFPNRPSRSSFTPQALASVWGRRPGVGAKGRDSDPSPTPKSILKRRSTDTTCASFMNGTEYDTLSPAQSSSSLAVASMPTTPRKRVTWIDDMDLPPMPVPGRIRRASTDVASTVAKAATTLVAVPSREAVGRVTKAASNLASLAQAVPLPRIGQKQRYCTTWLSDSEEEMAPRPSDHRDWVSYQRPYTQEDLAKEFPTLFRPRRPERPLEFNRRPASPAAASDDTFVTSSSRTPDPLPVDWDARNVALPPWLIEGKYRPKSDGPVFEEDDEGVRAALALPPDGSPAPALGLVIKERLEKERLFNPPSRVTSQTDLSGSVNRSPPLRTLSSADLLSSRAPSIYSPESSTSLDSQNIVTPSDSMVLPLSPEASDKFETADIPDGAVVMAPKPVTLWPPLPRRPYTGVSESSSVGSALTASMVASSILVACISIAAAP